MLIRRSSVQRPFASPSVQETEDRLPQKPARPLSPVYERDPLVHRTSAQKEKKADSVLLSILKDRKFHSVLEFDKALPNGMWIEGVKLLLSHGYFLDRANTFFRLRLRESYDKLQSIEDLIFGISIEELKRPVEPESLDEIEIEEDDDGLIENEFGNSEELPVESGLSVSDPPEDLVLNPNTHCTMMSAILARRRAGKSYLAMVLAEEMMKHQSQIPVVIIDPTGGWYGLLADPDGSASGFKIVVLGGRYADIPIDSKGGVNAAILLNKTRPCNMLLDLSDFSPSEQHEFVADFVGHFHSTSIRSPIHFFIDEADEFAPQRLDTSSEHQKRCLSVIDRFVRRGGIKGIGGTLITQRAAVLNKNVLSQSEALWFLNMGDPNDLAAASEWMKPRISDQHRNECIANLPLLKSGNAYFLQSGEKSIFRKIKVRQKMTFDSSKTPTGEDALVEMSSIEKNSVDPILLETAKSIFSKKNEGSSEG